MEALTLREAQFIIATLVQVLPGQGAQVTVRSETDMPALITPLVAIVLVLAGCASLSVRSTPQQAYVYDIAAPCRTMGFVDSFTGHTDGNYWALFREPARPPFQLQPSSSNA